jgi:hypothetical protein
VKKTEIKKLDKKWSEKIRSKNCEVCNGSDTNAHHIIGRRNYTLRWDVRNGCSLCPKHHVFGRESAHQDPIWFDQWLEEHRREDLEYLREQRNLVKKQTFEEVWTSMNDL